MSVEIGKGEEATIVEELAPIQKVSIKRTRQNGCNGHWYTFKEQNRIPQEVLKKWAVQNLKELRSNSELEVRINNQTFKAKLSSESKTSDSTQVQHTFSSDINKPRSEPLHPKMHPKTKSIFVGIREVVGDIFDVGIQEILRLLEKI